jgi:hypothetical protein
MIAVVTGFPTKIAALQFEWAWQHPSVSKAVRDPSKGLWTGRGAKAKLNILFVMLQLSPWSAWPLCLHFLSDEVRALTTRFPPLPAHIGWCSWHLAGAIIDELHADAPSDYTTNCFRLSRSPCMQLQM